MVVLNAESFSGTRLLDPHDVLAVFYAKWCPFCRSFLKLFEASMKEKTDPFGALVDISDTSNPLWETLDVQIIPTLIGFRNGQVFVRKDGIAGVGIGPRELEETLRKMENR